MKLHSFFESLRELRTFLLLFTTQALSSLGSAMTSYALVIWAYQQSGSALSTALLTVSSYAPYVVFSLFCGALVDRLDTRRTMLVSDALAACTTVAALVLLQTGRLQITHLYLLNALNGLMNTLQQPASEAATTALLPKSQYQRVGGLRYLSSSLSGLLTPVLAMALMMLGGLRAVMFADLATFAVAFTALLCFIRIPKRQTGSPHESFLDSTRQGLRFFRQAPGLLTLVLLSAIFPKPMSAFGTACIRWLYRRRPFVRRGADPEAAAGKWCGFVAEYHDAFAAGIRHRGKLAGALALALGQCTAYMSVAYCTYRGFGLHGVPFWQVTGTQVLLYIGASCFPMPGASGASEGTFYLAFSPLFGDYLTTAMLIWRLASYYLTIVLGYIAVVAGRMAPRRAET